MPICIECSYPVSQLYHVLHSTSSKSAAAAAAAAAAANTQPPTIPSLGLDDISSKDRSTAKKKNINEGQRGGGEASKARSAGLDVRLTQCPRCKRFADKYVEHDFVVLFIDLVLVKPQVYRHLLINRLGSSTNSSSNSSSNNSDNAVQQRFDPAIKRLAILLTLFDVYLTWSRIEALPPGVTASSPVPRWSIPMQYLFFLLLSIACTLAQHAAIRLFARIPWFRSPATVTRDPAVSHIPAAGLSRDAVAATPELPSGISISTALVVSSCLKLFPILMVVWKYADTGGQVARGVKWAVSVQNLEALRILLGIAYWQAGVLVLVGRAAEGIVEVMLLRLGGLGGVGLGWGLGLRALVGMG